MSRPYSQTSISRQSYFFSLLKATRGPVSSDPSIDLNVPLSLLNLPSIIPDLIHFESDIRVYILPTDNAKHVDNNGTLSEVSTNLENQNMFGFQQTETSFSSPMHESLEKRGEDDDDDLSRTDEKSYSRSTKRSWNEDDDELLKVLGTKYKNDWKKIMKRIINVRNIKMSPTFLRKRFMEIRELPMIKRSKFTHEEDLKLAQLIEKFGMNWMKISELFPERGAIMLKNRYYSYIRKKNLLENLQEENKWRHKNGQEVFSYEGSDLYSLQFEESDSRGEFEIL